MKTPSIPSFRMSFKSLILLTILVVPWIGFCQEPVQWSEGQRWTDFEQKVMELEREERRQGLAYMISGGLMLVGGVVGFNNASGSVEKLALSLTGTLGVGAIGFGYYQHSVGSPDRSFVNIVNSANELNLEQREALLNSYLALEKERAERIRFMRIVSHSLVAVMNLYQASRETDSHVKDLLYVIGGLNGLAAISIAF